MVKKHNGVHSLCIIEEQSLRGMISDREQCHTPNHSPLSLAFADPFQLQVVANGLPIVNRHCGPRVPCWSGGTRINCERGNQSAHKRRCQSQCSFMYTPTGFGFYPGKQTPSTCMTMKQTGGSPAGCVVLNSCLPTTLLCSLAFRPPDFVTRQPTFTSGIVVVVHR
jgi:hypothetical protein